MDASSGCLQLGEGHGARPADHQIRRRQTVCHIPDIFPDIHVGITGDVRPQLPQALGEQLGTIGAGGMDVHGCARWVQSAPPPLPWPG